MPSGLSFELLLRFSIWKLKRAWKQKAKYLQPYNLLLCEVLLDLFCLEAVEV